MAPGSGTTPGACELPEPTISGSRAAATIPVVMSLPEWVWGGRSRPVAIDRRPSIPAFRSSPPGRLPRTWALGNDESGCWMM